MSLSLTSRQKNNLYISSIHIKHYRTKPTEQLKRHILSSYSVCRITKGKGVIWINDSIFHCKKDDLFFLTPNMHIKGMSDTSFPIEYSIVLFTCIELIKRESVWCVEVPTFPRIGNLHLISLHKPSYLLLDQLFNHSISEKENIKQTLLLFLHSIRLIDQALVEKTKQVVSLDEIIHYMSNHYTDNLKISSLASSYGVSLNHFAKLFKKRMNTTPSEFLLKKRIHRAKQMLFTTQKNKQIAYQLGFQDEHYFSRIFKKSEGVAPTYYIKNKRLRIASMYYGLDDHLSTLGLKSISSLSYDRRVSCTLKPYRHYGLSIDSLEPDFEKLKYMHADYILTSDRYQPNYELNQIAPVAVVHHTNHYQDVLNHLAEILGKEQQAKQWIEFIGERKELLKERLRKTIGNQSVCFIRVGPKGYRIYGSFSHVGHLLYHDLGLTSPLPVIHKTIDLLREDVYPLIADYVFIMVDSNHEAQLRMHELIQSEVWNQLPSVQNKHIFEAHDLLFQPLGPKGYLNSIQFVTEKLINN